MQKSNEIRINYMNPVLIGIIMLLLGMTFSITQFKVVMNMGQIVESVNMSEHLWHWLMSLFTVFGIFLAIPSGTLVQKFGSKNILLFSAIVLIIGTIIGAFATDGTTLLVSRAIEGIGYAFMIVAAPAMVATYTNPSKVGISMGIFVCWVAVGQIVAFNLTPVLLNAMQGNWQNIWFFYAFAILIFTIIVKLFVNAPVPAVSIEKPDSVDEKKPSLLDVLKNKHLIFAAIAYCGFNSLVLGLLTYMTSVAQGAGMNETQAAFASSIPMIGCLISSPIFGKISLRAGCKKPYIFGLAFSGIGYILAFSSSIPMIYVGVIVFGLLGLGVPGMAFSSVPDLVKNPKLVGMGTGIIVTFQALGMFLGSTFFPSFVSFGGSDFMGAVFYATPIALISILCILMAKFR